MSTIEFVVRDGAGGLNRGFVGGAGNSQPLLVEPGSNISLNLNQGQILSYGRSGTSLEITLVDGQVIVIDNFFGIDGRAANDLFLSTGGGLTEVNLVEGQGGVYFSTYTEADVYGKWGPDEDLYFLGDSPVLLAGAPEAETGMLATGFLAGFPVVPALLASGAAAAAAGTVLDDNGTRPDEDTTTDDPTDDAGDDDVTGGDGDVTGGGGGDDATGGGGDDTIGGGDDTTGGGGGDTTGGGDDTTGGGDDDTTGGGDDDSTGGGDDDDDDDDTPVDDDTVVSFDEDAVGGDGVVNAEEEAAGVVLTGTTEEGSTVVVTINGTDYEADVEGEEWTVTIPPGDLPQGEYVQDVTVTATDEAGNTATTDGSFDVDTVHEVTLDGPITADNVINNAEAGQGVTLTGTAEPGATVVVNAGGLEATVTADADGNWSVTYEAELITSGEYGADITVTATDGAGNVATTSGTVDIDTFVNDLSVTSGPVTADDIVNDVEQGQTITLSGTVEAGSSVTVTLAGVTLEAEVSGGSWTVTYPAGALPPGEYEADLIVSATDAAGNSATITDTFQVDTEIDVSIDQPVEGNDVINGQEALDGTLLTGTADAGAIVTVTFAGITRTTVATQDGTWSMGFAASEIPAGESMQNITVTATDVAGNVAGVSHQVEVDTYVNELTSNDPVEGDNIVNREEAGDGITLTGTVEVGSTVFVTFEGLTREATVSNSGNWSVTFAPGEIPAGEYEAQVTIAATDAHGNTDQITDTFLVDTNPPEAPLVESYTRAGEGVRSISTTLTDEEVDLFAVSADGGVTNVAHDQEVDTAFNELSFDFDAPVPNGSQLVINASDESGNSTATLFVLEEQGTNVVDVSNSGYDGFDLEAIDLQFAEEAELTLSASDLEALCAHSNTLTIHGGADDTVRIEGASSNSETSEIAGKTYVHYDLGDNGGTLIIDETINVIT
ncbi:Ig-like domain-containing protein [Alexandriicola marinus]|uniref:Ig-like domain-containing protein n=1 Tax=Alexandriicola marinus TaxID=2081710 RepID=UPI003B847791